MTPQAAEYRLLSLGRTEIVDGTGTPIDFPLGKPFGILAYLSLAADPVARDELATVFWNGGDRSKARHSLRQALSFLRSHLGDEVFGSDDPVALDPAVLDSDVARLTRALDENEVEKVRELYRGPFLDTFQLAATPAWSHWVEAQRRILDERVATALRQAAEQAPPGAAVDLMRRVVAVEPHRATHREALVDVLLEAGEVEAATAALAEARQADLDDGSTLEKIAGRIRTVRHEKLHLGQSEDLRAEFVGRTAELATLTSSWRRTVRGQREVAIVSGPTGIGKTRLAEELSAVAAAAGQVVRVKAAATERRLEWSVMAELVRTLHRLPGAAGVDAGAEQVLRSLVPSLGGPPTEGGALPRPVAISDALVDLISAVAFEAPLLIVIDDLQWVDRPSLSALMRVIRQTADEPVMIVLTYRTEELSARAASTLATMVDQEGATTIRLHPLSAAEVEELLTLSGLQAPAPRIRELAEKLHAVTRGHPLFLIELLRSLQEDGILETGNSEWRLSDPAPMELELPASMRLVIHKRLERLSDPARTVAGQLAALAPSAGLERVRAGVDLSDAEFTAALNELIDRAVVGWGSAGRLVFTHDQLREAMAEDQRTGSRWRHVAAALVLVALAGIAAWAVAAGETPERWGGGTILVPDGDSLLAFDPAAPPDEWSAGPAPIRTPPVAGALYRFRPRRLADGRVAWFGSLPGDVEAPEGVVYWGGGEVTERHWPGDDNVQAVSPDGRRLAWVTQHYGGDGYAKALRLVDVDADTGRVVAGPASFFQTAWSNDGTRVATSVSLASDSLLVLSPGGDRLRAWSFFQIILEDWCGPDRILALIRPSADAERIRLLLDPATGDETVLEENALPGARCSPDGTAYVGRAVDNGRLRLMVHEIGTPARYPLPSPLDQGLKVWWVSDSVPPVPVGLAARQDTLQLVRGATRTLQADLLLSDSTRRDTLVRWRSADPALASIVSSATLAANRAGETVVIGEYGGWWADTVHVRVVEGPGESVILSDDFRTLDPTRWYTVGHPAPGIRPLGPRPVLELRGDGRYTDGLISRAVARAPAGFTAELELQMPLNQDEYQGFALQVGNYRPPAEEDGWDHLSAWHYGDGVVLALPAFELEKWDPELVALRSFSSLEALGRIPESTDLSSWTHLALQVQADGVASIWIDRQEVTRFRMPQDFLQAPLRVAIMGDTHGTYGYVRNLTWWAEPRYR